MLTFLHLAIVTLLLHTQIMHTSAAVVTWVGTNGNWSVGSNWSSGMVPQISDVVTIDNGSTVSLDVNSGAILSLKIDNNSQLNILMGSILSFEGESDEALYLADGQITNNGTINIPTYIGTGIRIDSACTFLNHSNVFADFILDGEGIFCAGNLVNNGLISITFKEGGLAALSILSGGSLTNNLSGTVHIDNVFEGQGRGMGLSGSLVNHGRINIMNTEGAGVSCSGTCTNYDTISLTSTRGFSVPSFTNRSSGVLDVGQSKNAGSTNAAALRLDELINEGTIVIDEAEAMGVRFDSSMIPDTSHNRGSIQISNCSGPSLRIASVLVNEPGAAIEISESNEPDIEVIRLVEHSLTNYGNISIDLVKGHGFTMSQVGISPLPRFSIPVGGILTIDRLDGDPLIVNSGAIVDCLGVIDIK